MKTQLVPSLVLIGLVLIGLVLIGLVLIGLVLIGAATGRAFAARDNAVNVTIEATLAGGHVPSIEGRTNLPDGTQLTVSLQPGNSACAADCLPLETDIVVRNGRFTAGPLSRNGRIPPPGAYTLEITSTMARLQAVSVQQIIGPRGEYMIGKYVRPSDEIAADALDEHIVDYTTTVTLP